MTDSLVTAISFECRYVIDPEYNVPRIYCAVMFAVLKYPQYVYLVPCIENFSSFAIGTRSGYPSITVVNIFVYESIATPIAEPIPETVPKNNEVGSMHIYCETILTSTYEQMTLQALFYISDI